MGGSLQIRLDDLLSSITPDQLAGYHHDHGWKLSEEALPSCICWEKAGWLNVSPSGDAESRAKPRTELSSYIGIVERSINGLADDERRDPLAVLTDIVGLQEVVAAVILVTEQKRKRRKPNNKWRTDEPNR